MVTCQTSSSDPKLSSPLPPSVRSANARFLSLPLPPIPPLATSMKSDCSSPPRSAPIASTLHLQHPLRCPPSVPAMVPASTLQSTLKSTARALATEPSQAYAPPSVSTATAISSSAPGADDAVDAAAATVWVRRNVDRCANEVLPSQPRRPEESLL